MSISQIMKQDATGQQLVDFAKETGRQLYREDLQNTQIRNIFTEARRVEAEWNTSPDRAMRRLNGLKPKLAYQVKRHERVRGVRTLAQILTEAITEVQNTSAGEPRAQAFARFMELFESILAYHYAGDSTQ